jgi:hypothetical protein
MVEEIWPIMHPMNQNMGSRHKMLLLIDGVVNLAIGAVLLLFPLGIVEALGLPPVSSHFYATILGAVIFGIGVALLIELRGPGGRVSGLGLAGAIAINFCGGLVLALWMIFGHLAIPLRGQVILWIVAAIVIIIGMVELASGSWRYRDGGARR